MSYYIVPFHKYHHGDLDITKKVIVASMDPGLTNFAIRVEKRKPHRTPKTIYYKLINFGGKKATRVIVEKKRKFIKIWGTVIEYLETITPILDNVNLFLIEHQLSYNHSVDQLSNFVLGFIMFRYKDRSPYPMIIKVSPKLKSILLPNKGKGLSKYKLKKESEKAAAEILEERKDKYSIKIVNAHKKKDDLSDVVLQTEAFFTFLADE